MTNEGIVFTWGLGAHGQLGHVGDTSQRECPAIVTDLFGSRAVCVSCGGSFTTVVDTRGRVIEFGSVSGGTGGGGAPGATVANAAPR